MKPRDQGDLGEFSAIDWLGSIGAAVYVPLGNSPDVDVVGVLDDEVMRVQVKTSTRLRSAGRWEVAICTRGGNQSWSGVVKRFSAKRCSHLFVLVGDGRRWCIPATRVEASTGIVVGGPKYAEFEVERGRPITAARAA